jgi:limonene-1,2-epoxide hydrolase
MRIGSGPSEQPSEEQCRASHLTPEEGHTVLRRLMGIFETQGDDIIAWRDYVDVNAVSQLAGS